MLCKGNLKTRKLLRQHNVQLFVSILHSTVAMFKTKESEDKYKQSVSEFITCLQNKDTSHRDSEQIIQTITDLLHGVMGPDLFIVRECLSGILAVSDDEADMSTVGRQWVYVGLLGMLLHKPRSPVDPVVKTQIKLQLKQRELEEINTDIEVKVIHHRQMTGLHLLDTPSHLQHPLILHLIDRREKLQRQIEALQSRQAYRPSACQYKQLLNMIRDFDSTKGSATHTIQLMEKLLTICKSGELSNEIAEERTWQKTHQRLVSSLEEEFPLYRDITTPFIVALQQVRCGMRLIAGCATEANNAQQLTDRLKVTSQVHETVGHIREAAHLLVKFPFISSDVFSSWKLAQKILLVERLVSGCRGQVEENGTEQTSRLYLGALFLLRNSAMMRKELNREILMSLHQIFNRFVLSWKHQEEIRRQKEADEGLYKYKTNLHGDDRDNDVIEEEEFRQNFPSFQQDFQDLMTPYSLEDTGLSEPLEPEIDDASQRVTDREVAAVSHTHQLLFSSLSSSDWLQQSHVTEVMTKDITEPSLLCYSIAAPLFRGQWNLSEVERQTLGSHLVASQTLQEDISLYMIIRLRNHHQGYDVYRDPNLSEVIQCVPILQRLMVRVRELQQEWPDHPTLIQ
ncbi:midasin-like, partial [Saccostrea cucullata]|uniref:midasin-like n=1 Tax=Saccostrea cuccullata TaxID=36930 RepID=UPI002ED190D7